VVAQFWELILGAHFGSYAFWERIFESSAFWEFILEVVSAFWELILEVLSAFWERNFVTSDFWESALVF
jgi:hypothetical protein